MSSAVTTARRQTKHFLTSKIGHYSVLALVSIDVTAIFIDLILQLETCEGRLRPEEGDKAQEVLGDLSLIFSCLFMVELLASIWAFGWQYFKSWFHWLDATVILAGFVLDVLLKGVLEEVGSLVVVLRLWRVFKIIEELSAGAEEQMEPLQEKIGDLEKQCGELRRQVEQLKSQRSLPMGTEAV
ncbi:Uu.00g029030.m01.CDS01 [Anthostomella pinea]|uniref:Voltage-gated hydrogen channel 1 n=1 Tax=Anthostomella pinea TaxID=933095 RepID=A0AAI8V920_9PEZI|nr:Uu.00g029030.m01.CDS01 [Anthostomella pinea]